MQVHIGDIISLDRTILVHLLCGIKFALFSIRVTYLLHLHEQIIAGLKQHKKRDPSKIELDLYIYKFGQSKIERVEFLFWSKPHAVDLRPIKKERIRIL